MNCWGSPPAGKNRNGYGRKMVVADTDKTRIEVPRDRAGSFDQQLTARHQRRCPGSGDPKATEFQQLVKALIDS